MAGTVGLLRFPDTLTRLHALTKADNLGLGLIVLGLLPHAGGSLGALKLVSVWLLVQLSGAIVTQLIARSVRRRTTPMIIALRIRYHLSLRCCCALRSGSSSHATRFSAIVIFMVYGLLLSLAWVRLAAVDVALTEAAIGSGVTGMLLLNAAASLRGADPASSGQADLASTVRLCWRPDIRWALRRWCCSR